MASLYLLITAYAWATGTLIAVVIAGIGIRQYGRRLERQTQEQIERRPL